MAREKGIFNAASNYEPLIGAPFDARSVVNYKSDLIDPNSWVDDKKYLYNGMLVSVAKDTDENNGLYRLNNRLQYTDYSAWEKIAELKDLEKIQTQIDEQFNIVDGNIATINNQIETLSQIKGLPDVTAADAGKFLRVNTAGNWIAESVLIAEEQEGF